MCTCMGVRSLWASSVMDLGINQAGPWMKLLSCRIPVSLASLAFPAEAVLVFICKCALLFVQGGCPGWAVGGSMQRVEAILVSPVVLMLQAGIVQELRRSSWVSSIPSLTLCNSFCLSLQHCAFGGILG